MNASIGIIVKVNAAPPITALAYYQPTLTYRELDYLFPSQ